MADFLAGRIQALDVIRKWPNPEKSMSVEEARLLHELNHYYADEDIRITDKEYGVMQIENLRKLYALLHR